MATLDMAGIITRICTKLQTKFSKVSIGRTSSDGSQIAVITIDGIQYSLRAPTPPSASIALPQMDGVASAGSSTGAASGYSRGNHVHPTDTSRQEKLVSGTNIKTINNNSLLGSGNIAIPMLPTVTASDNGKVLKVVNGAWAAATLPTYNGGVS